MKQSFELAISCEWAQQFIPNVHLMINTQAFCVKWKIKQQEMA